VIIESAGSDKLLKKSSRQKRKVDYGELSFQENQSSPEPMEHLEERAEKETSFEKRKLAERFKDYNNTGKKSQ